MQTPNEEAVDADQLARLGNVNVLLGTGIARRLKRRRVTSDQPEPLGAGVQPVAAEHLPNPVRGDKNATPLGPGKLSGDALWTQSRVAQRESHYPLLDVLGELVGHLRCPSLPRAQHLKAMSVDPSLPGVIRRAVHPKPPAGLGD